MAAMMRSRAFTPFTTARPNGLAFGRIAQPLLAPSRPLAARTQRGALQVVAAEDDKKAGAKKKKVPSPVKRAMLAEERRMYNRSHKSACATRIKKVIKLATTLTGTPVTAEEEVKPLEKLVAEAYQEIDKAVSKGVLHKNNGARKKARVARYKRQVLMAAGLYKPAADHPDFAKAARLVAAVEKSKTDKEAAATKAAAAPKAAAAAAVGGKAGKAQKK